MFPLKQLTRSSQLITSKTILPALYFSSLLHKQISKKKNDNFSKFFFSIDNTPKDLKQNSTFTYYEEQKENQYQDGKYQLLFTCNVCNTRQQKQFSHNAYHKGVVLIKCDNCNKVHLVADNLGWFDDQKINLETILKEKQLELIKLDKQELSKKLDEFVKQEKSKLNVI